MRAQTLSPERRREIAASARFVRSQRERGELPITEQRTAVIGLVHLEDPDLASFLKAASLMPSKYRERLQRVLSDAERELIVKSQRIVSWTVDKVR